jgi:hypothetical protein
VLDQLQLEGLGGHGSGLCDEVRLEDEREHDRG